MTQLTLDLPQMHSISLFCRLDGQLARWETHAVDPGAAIKACQEELKQHKGSHSAVLALVHLPIANS